MEYPFYQNGGTEALVRELTVRLAMTCRIVLVTPDSRDAIPPAIIGSIADHISLPLPHSRASGDRLAAALATHEISLAHFHLGGTYTWNTRNFLTCPIPRVRKQGIPYLITNHGVFGFYGYCGADRSYFFRLATLPFFWLSRLFLIARSQCELMVSQNDLRKMQRWFFPVRQKLGYVYHSLLPEKPPVQPLPREKRFLCVGTIGSRKGQWLLTEAFARIHEEIPDWRLILVGRFADEEIKERVLAPLENSALRAKVEFIKNATDVEVKRLYQSSEIFVMPSLEEGLGLTLQEALFHGCACIASRAGGTEDLITDGDNGLLVDRNDGAQLARAMKTLAKDSGLRSLFSGRGPQSIREKGMSAPAMAARYLKIYYRILGNKGFRRSTSP